MLDTIHPFTKFISYTKKEGIFCIIKHSKPFLFNGFYEPTYVDTWWECYFAVDNKLRNIIDILSDKYVEFCTYRNQVSIQY